MPPGYFILVGLPTQVDYAAVAIIGEVYETGTQILHMHAEVFGPPEPLH